MTGAPSLVAAIVAGALVAGACGREPRDEDDDGIPDAFEQALAQQLLPVILASTTRAATGGRMDESSRGILPRH